MPSIIAYNHLSINFGFFGIGALTYERLAHPPTPPPPGEYNLLLTSLSVVSNCFATHGLYSPPGSFVGFLRQEYWGGLPFPPQVDLPNTGIEPALPALQEEVKIMGVLMSAKLRKT